MQVVLLLVLGVVVLPLVAAQLRVLLLFDLLSNYFGVALFLTKHVYKV